MVSPALEYSNVDRSINVDEQVRDSLNAENIVNQYREHNLKAQSMLENHNKRMGFKQKSLQMSSLTNSRSSKFRLNIKSSSSRSPSKNYEGKPYETNEK